MHENETTAVSRREKEILAEVLRAIRRVGHGYVQVIVQDGKAIQIDTMEKKRLDQP
ncbi:MAG TPA: YezD family protein [Dehalococcoidia bacterium]|nr:YezD family protein [Dehalococcoidia bacterium]